MSPARPVARHREAGRVAPHSEVQLGPLGWLGPPQGSAGPIVPAVMARYRSVLVAALALAAAAPSAHGAAVRALPTDDRVVTTLQTTDRCRDGRTRPRGAV